MHRQPAVARDFQAISERLCVATGLPPQETKERLSTRMTSLADLASVDNLPATIGKRSDIRGNPFCSCDSLVFDGRCRRLNMQGARAGAIEMGFDPQKVKRLQQQQQAATGAAWGDTQELLEALMMAPD